MRRSGAAVGGAIRLSTVTCVRVQPLPTTTIFLLEYVWPSVVSLDHNDSSISGVASMPHHDTALSLWKESVHAAHTSPYDRPAPTDAR
jgi:hypothetical protein